MKILAALATAMVIGSVWAGSVLALNLAEVRDLLKTQAIHATPSTPEEFATLLRTDAARYAKIAREANVKVD